VSRTGSNPQFSAEAKIGFEAALREVDHHAEHWDTPDHGSTGHLIAEALRSSVEIARRGGLECKHREWRCTFVARTGGQAGAGFSSAEEARQFAQRHAEAIGVDGDWVEDDGYWLLSTIVGNYFVTRI
jgi:hypothetical protein